MANELGEPILTIEGIRKDFGAQPVLYDASLTVHDGDRIGLVGRNGSGKSTLLKIIMGIEGADSGRVTTKQGLRIGMLLQQPDDEGGRTIGDLLRASSGETMALLQEHDALAGRIGEIDHESKAYTTAMNRLEELHHRLELLDAWNFDERMKRASQALALPDLDRPLSGLSGGERRRADIAAAVLAQPDLLMLDEPTNHIDTQSVEWIENYLAAYAGACIFVTHDRYFLERLATRIVEVEFAKLTAYPGNYSAFLERKAALADHTAKAESNRRSFVRRELEWLRRGPKARATKQKARIQRAETAIDTEAPKQHNEIRFEFPEPPRLGRRILEAHQIARSLGGKTLFEHFSLNMSADMRIGIVGRNGCGKSTLLRTLMVEEAPDAGTVKLGETTRFIYIDQNHEAVHPETTVLNFFSDGAYTMEVAGRKVHVPAYLAQFLFDESVTQMVMGKLSGGERNRLDIAKKLLQGGNVLVLDEPTNDLDLPALRVLEEVILSWPGCALIVTHDRYFLNRVCTHLIVFEDDGSVHFLTGDYDDYLLFRERRMQSEKAEALEALEATSAAPPAPSRSRTRTPKLSWSDKKELEGMEARILAAESAVEALDAEVHTPDFYKGDAAVVQTKLRALEEAKREVEQLYARWQHLEQVAAGLSANES